MPYVISTGRFLIPSVATECVLKPNRQTWHTLESVLPEWLGIVRFAQFPNVMGLLVNCAGPGMAEGSCLQCNAMRTPLVPFSHKTTWIMHSTEVLSTDSTVASTQKKTHSQ